MGPAISKARLTRRDASIVRCAAPARPSLRAKSPWQAVPAQRRPRFDQCRRASPDSAPGSAAQSDTAFDGYRRRLNRSLAAQQREQLTQRAILGSVEEVLGKALEVLEGLPFDMSAVTVERGRSALTPEVQKPFRNFMQSLLDDVVAFNRTSCALSNFPRRAPPVKGIRADHSPRHCRGLAGIFTVRQPVAAGKRNRRETSDSFGVPSPACGGGLGRGVCPTTPCVIRSPTLPRERGRELHRRATSSIAGSRA